MSLVMLYLVHYAMKALLNFVLLVFCNKCLIMFMLHFHHSAVCVSASCWPIQLVYENQLTAAIHGASWKTHLQRHWRMCCCHGTCSKGLLNTKFFSSIKMMMSKLLAVLSNIFRCEISLVVLLCLLVARTNNITSDYCVLWSEWIPGPVTTVCFEVNEFQDQWLLSALKWMNSRTSDYCVLWSE